MKAKLLALVMVCAGGAMVAQPAAACMALTGWTIEAGIADPAEEGISAGERERRLVALEQWMLQRRERRLSGWLDRADHGRSGSPIEQARDLIEVVLPPPVAVTTATCNPPFPYYSDEDDRYYRALREAIPLPPRFRDGARDGSTAFRNRYLALAHGCRAESRDGMVGRLLGKMTGRFEDVQIARVWHTVARLGFLQRDVDDPRAMFAFAEGDTLQLIDDPEFAPPYLLTGIEDDPRSIVDTRIARENWEEMQRFWGEDADGREFVAIIGELYADMARPELPFSGLCPETRRNVEALARAHLLHIQRDQTDVLDEFLVGGS